MASFEWHFRAATGFLELGMLDDAATELAEIDPKEKLRPEVIDFWVALYCRARKWDAMEAMARKMVALRSEDPGTWIKWAFATRRAASIDAAREILLQAEEKHPDDPTIQFNMGCYACQTGNLAEASERVKKAIQIDASFRDIAMNDPDLEPIWDKLRSA